MSLSNSDSIPPHNPETFRLAFELASDAMALSDADGSVFEANQAYFDLYGYSAEEVINHDF
jgi:PAS domain S-box-containing protein